MILTLTILAYLAGMTAQWLYLDRMRFLETWGKCIGSVLLNVQYGHGLEKGDHINVNDTVLQVYEAHPTYLTVGNIRP